MLTSLGRGPHLSRLVQGASAVGVAPLLERGELQRAARSADVERVAGARLHEQGLGSGDAGGNWHPQGPVATCCSLVRLNLVHGSGRDRDSTAWSFLAPITRAAIKRTGHARAGPGSGSFEAAISLVSNGVPTGHVGHGSTISARSGNDGTLRCAGQRYPAKLAPIAGFVRSVTYSGAAR